MKIYFIVWLIGSIGLIPSLLFAQQRSMPAQPTSPSMTIPIPSQTFVTGRWPKTGEKYYIDPAHSLANKIEQSRTISDGDMINVLQVLFSGPLFRHPLEEGPQNALYIFCGAEQLLREFSRNAKDGNLRSALGNATTRIISLRDQISAAQYGTNFDIAAQFQHHGSTLSSFIDSLPGNTGDRGDLIRQQATLRQFRDYLKPFNIVN